MYRITVFIVILLGVSYAGAQTLEITNADLEKFRAKRLAAEKELRENYAKLGFASPEERAKQAEKEEKERTALVDKLRVDRRERERIEVERLKVAAEIERASQPQKIIIERNDQDRNQWNPFGWPYQNRGWNGLPFPQNGMPWWIIP
ncbi:MAG TPA: hypothetical protein VJ781_05740 [Pyrinomonadaceae bacterium]|jgi:hypothetical protein|nr:hypothetical protein [Pyrinomonadaceae bacterium]